MTQKRRACVAYLGDRLQLSWDSTVSKGSTTDCMPQRQNTKFNTLQSMAQKVPESAKWAGLQCEPSL